MKKVKPDHLPELITSFANKDVYVRLKRQTARLPTHLDEGFFDAGAFVRCRRQI